ncbi:MULTISPECIES: DUF2635 domain-containing protein [Snodgrassella]|uniref:DUF2635 domain-containing protein n=1 Tax=Snodgrassella TaxID=1193515 RepID=UPI000568E2B3|nr:MULTISPECIES: DUF2635 domain-containing protein [Snodgrassella]MBI0067565.1 DUF2635 domain-containing protein [Snodgrassella sp. M0110]MBI0076471.1 DUF2635 domain-containing protein [Snodgrassella sp. M0118]MBI0078865.1 DUF2635 domain-containing protein [Snodgrassella sp. M0112]NUF78199.1 DUF2635 domain-containing protein [Snodgrassella sp. ESL0323]
MKVKAADGLRVPKENRVNSYITNQPVEVPESLYYRRLVNDGDLIMVTENLKENEIGVNE